MITYFALYESYPCDQDDNYSTVEPVIYGHSIDRPTISKFSDIYNCNCSFLSRPSSASNDQFDVPFCGRKREVILYSKRAHFKLSLPNWHAYGTTFYFTLGPAYDK